jgi:Flavoprotein
VVVFSTPFGTRFADVAGLERLTGQPVRSEYRMPGTGSPVPPADVVLACLLTFNSVNKFAHGHADNFAIGLLCEMAGYGVPVVVVPHCKPQLASHPAFAASLETLRGMGVRVLFDPDAPYERRLPPWSEVVAALQWQPGGRRHDRDGGRADRDGLAGARRVGTRRFRLSPEAARGTRPGTPRPARAPQAARRRLPHRSPPGCAARQPARDGPT